MPNLLTTIQSIAVNAVNSTNPISFVFGTVTSESPLRIRIDQNTINLEGGSLILTSAVIERKLIIEKHNHGIGSELENHVHAYTCAVTGTPTSTTPPFASYTPPGPGVPFTKKVVDDTIISAKCIENKDEDHPLPVDPDASEADKKERIVVVINRALKKDDKVVMLRVCGGQRFVVLSRVF